MEEQILKIIKKRINQIQTQEGLSVKITSNEEKAKEITSMVFEFIEWLSFGDHLFYPEDKSTWTFYKNEEDLINDKGHLKTTQKVFQYWWDNVKNK
jgi:hypothetical protein